MSDSSDNPPRGLVFPGLQNSRKRKALFPFLTVVLVAGIALIWPVYPFAGSIRPYILGLPLSLAWVVGWLLVVFAASVLFYRVDKSGETD